MPAVDADRNLLFGVLSLQMDFITSEALIAALNAWVLEKSKPLGRILVDQAALTHDEYALLDALVVKHLEKHRGNPEASLSAVGTPPAASRALLERVSDPELRAGLSRLKLTDPLDDTDLTQTFARAPVDDGPGRFHILRAHAEGGLGRVFVAVDRQLHREVALKQIKEERAGAEQSRDRFLFEAEVTGGLEHPGIVPVYGLGRYDDGRPYYAMRFIKGETLKEAISAFHATERSNHDPLQLAMTLRQLLGRFVTVCNAVAYAHSRGVLHRDLKPSNIMLGKYGETLVVDWGLAKAVDRPDVPGAVDERTLRPSSGSDDQGTLPGAPIGTPDYMSPEQAEGRLDQVGFASDVYSLGATLYCLLTGRSPFDRRAVGSGLAARVVAGDFPPPRRLKAKVPRALEAICLKAMARRPTDRYASPLELASDLEHWLADEPVSAYREPLSTQAGRWVRRHKTLVAASAVLVASALVGLLINNQMVRQQRDKALRAEARAEAARGEAELARNEAERARREEAGARTEAEASSVLARRVVDQMLVKVADDGLPHVPQMGQFRKEVSHDALQFAREFLRRRPADRVVRREAAMITRRVANIERLTNDFAAALAHYAEAESMFEKLAADFPDIARYRDLLAEFELDFAEALTNAARSRDALPHYQKALDIARTQHATKPDDPNYRRTLARIQNDFGLVLFEAGQTREGLDRCDEAVAIFAELARRQPLHFAADPLLQLMSLVDRAPLQRDAGMLAEAEQSLADSVAIAHTLLGKNPADTNVRYYLAMARSRQGTILAEDHKNAADAETAFDESVRALSELRTSFPDVGFYRPAHAEALSGRGGARAELGRLADADKDCQQAQQTLEAILAESARDLKATTLLARTLARRARIARSRGDAITADQLGTQAISRQQTVVTALPDNARARRVFEQLRDEHYRPARQP